MLAPIYTGRFRVAGPMFAGHRNAANKQWHSGLGRGRICTLHSETILKVQTFLDRIKIIYRYHLSLRLSSE